MKKHTLSLLLAVACALSLLGCGGVPAPDAQTSAPAGSEIPAAVDQTREIVFAASRNQCLDEQDACYASTSLSVRESPITKDESGKPTLALATEWEHNEDSTAWTFHLREGVTFSNGAPFNADSALANFDRMKRGSFESSFYGMNTDTVYPGLVSYEKTDDYTVVLTLSEGQPLLDCTTVNYGSAVLEPSCSAEDGILAGLLIGTGPYVVIENVLGQYCIIERNDNYWGTPGTAKTLRFKAIPDAETRYTALRVGEVRGLCDPGTISPSQVTEIDGDPIYNVSAGDLGITHFLNVNGGTFPFNDVHMREGPSLLLDRQTIIDSFYNGYDLAAGGFLNYISTFYHGQPVQHDPERDAELIREVVGDQEVELLFLLPGMGANRYPYQEEAEHIQSLLENIEGANIKVSIQQMDWSPCKEEMEVGNYNLCLKVQDLPSVNPFSLLKGLMYTEGGTSISYDLGYHNDHVDELIEEAVTCPDADRLTEIYTELQEISAVDFSNIPVLYFQEMVASPSDITGYQATMYDLTGFIQVCWAG